jgi:3-oxoacyl-[acyl-carrier-protein] synthase II
MITGMGVVSPIGFSAEEAFRNAAEGVCGIREATEFDAERTGIRVAGEVVGFDPSRDISTREAKRMARFTQFAVYAAQQHGKAAASKTAATGPSAWA